MSLIIEALKRARDDAVRRQAASKGLPLAPVPRLEGRSRWLTLALIPLTGALIICILLLVDLYSRRPYSSTDPPTAELQPTAAAQVQAPSPITERAVVAREETSPPPTQAVEESARFLQTGDAVGPTAPRRSTDEPAAREVSEPNQQPATDSPDQEAREFIGQAHLRDGQLIDLGGIAWSESEPFALLNGQVVGVGEHIRTYEVIEIQQDQVVLQKDSDRIVLKLK